MLRSRQLSLVFPATDATFTAEQRVHNEHLRSPQGDPHVGQATTMAL